MADPLGEEDTGISYRLFSCIKEPFKKVSSLLKNGGAFHIYMADEETLTAKKAPGSVFNKFSIQQIIEAFKIAGFVKGLNI